MIHTNDGTICQPGRNICSMPLDNMAALLHPEVQHNVYVHTPINP